MRHARSQPIASIALFRRKQVSRASLSSPGQQFNPLSPDSDQHQFSPNNIHMLPREMVIRVNKMFPKGKML